MGAGSGLAAGVLVSVLLQAQGRIDSMEPLAFGAGALGMGATAIGWASFLVLSALVGTGYALVYRFQPGRLIVALAGGLLFGLLWWALLWLTIMPVAAGVTPTWSMQQAVAAFPQLVASIFFGALTSVCFHGACSVFIGDRATPRALSVSTVPPRHRIVVVGGGFGGVAAAKRLEELLAHRPDVNVTLVSRTNFLVFTPLLAEVASGTLIPRHVAVPLRAACPRTTLRVAGAEEVDPVARTVRIRSTTGGPVETLGYDELILASGAVPAFRDLPGLAENALTLKSVADAVGIHDRVIATLERAESEPEAAERRRLLTFVVVGGGFAGVETIAELRDFVHGSLIHYPHAAPDELRFVLVHSGKHLLPELAAELGAYARERLERRGIELRLGVRLASAEPGGVALSDGTTIPTATFIWTAGNQPATVPGTLGHAGASSVMTTDGTLRVTGLEHVWAVGDCARIPDPGREGEACPPTAQHALRQGRLAGSNVIAAIDGRVPKTFRFRTLGVLVVLGHNTAVADIRGRRFSGLLAWVMWRAVYLSKLPGLERKSRVLFDWLLDLAYPRDIVMIGTTDPNASRPARRHATGEPPAAPSGGV